MSNPSAPAPLSVEVHVCPIHGPFIEQDSGAGCPVQVDYDGITCTYYDPQPKVYVPA